MPGRIAAGEHYDAPLSNIAIKAFASRDNYIADKIFPVVSVGKQSDKYYVIEKGQFLSVPDTRRSPMVAPNEIQFNVSSESYFAFNYALASKNSLEDLANTDMAIMLRENSVNIVIEGLARDLEVRVANKVTSLTNLGSGTALTGTSKWSDFGTSDPLADISTGHAFIRNNTGLEANTAVIDYDTLAIIRRHPLLLDMYKYTSGGELNDNQLKELFRVQNVLVARGVKNTAIEGAADSISTIWGNFFGLFRIQPGMSLQTQSFGLAMRWQPAGIATAMQVERYKDPNPGAKAEIVASGYYQDEKIVATDLSYGISGTL